MKHSQGTFGQLCWGQEKQFTHWAKASWCNVICQK